MRERNMSIRQTILAALNNQPGQSATMDELVDATGETRHRLSDNMTGAVKEGLVAKTKDDLTGMPLYILTEKGEARIGKPHQQPPRKTQADDDEMPPADPVLLASANRMLADRLAGVAHALRGSGLWDLSFVDGNEDLQPHVAALTGAYRLTRADLAAAQAVLETYETAPAQAPLFYMAYSNGVTPSVVSNSLDEARRDCENLALQDGIAYVCAVIAQCESTVTWKDAA